MNFLKKEWNAAIYTLTHWLMPPSMRRYDAPVQGSRLYRYPSVGSEPAFHDETAIDYKTAYRDSLHHIRNNVDTHKMLQEYLYVADPVGSTPEEKLRTYGYLRTEEFGNAEAFQRAKEQYEKDIGESLDVKVHFDDFGYVTPTLSKNREAVGEYISSYFEGLKQHNASEGWSNDLDDIYNGGEFVVFRTFDLAGNDPVLRQMLVDMDGSLDEIANGRVELGQIDVFKGDPAYWAILDDSNTGENRKKVQASVKNYIGNEDLTPVVYGEGEIPAQKETPTYKVPHVSPYVE